jgi:hypothetical protein
MTLAQEWPVVGAEHAPPDVPALDPGAELRIRVASTEEAIRLRRPRAALEAPAAAAALLRSSVHGCARAALSPRHGLVEPRTHPPALELLELLQLRALQLVAPRDPPEVLGPDREAAPRAGRRQRFRTAPETNSDPRIRVRGGVTRRPVARAYLARRAGD